ncbi:restriction endonuclease subunit S, partial [Clostridium perfringens]|uniref:restriction endonuclease subunit S n=1 Tax=Clostridium perfringens TaxID=1502 RepID=UPI002AC41683
MEGYESTVDLPCFDVSEELDVRFLLEYVQRTNFYKKYGEIADGGRKAKRIQVDTFLGFPMYVPRILEQQKIADCLSSLDDLIIAEDKKLEALKAHRKGLMQKLFPAEGKTVPEWRFPEFRDCGEWGIYSLGGISQNLDSKRVPISEKDRKSGSTPYYGASG